MGMESFYGGDIGRKNLQNLILIVLWLFGVGRVCKYLVLG